MRKLFIIIASLFLGLAVNAQEAIFDARPLVSPEIKSDGTITFRYRNPSAKAVQVIGDFLPTKEIDTPRGKAEVTVPGEMQKDSAGVWVFTTSCKVESGMYTYRFSVDGSLTIDPSNMFVNRDVATLSSALIVSGGIGDLFKVQEVPHGTVSRVWYPSKASGFSRRMTVYTPAGYENSSKTRYPVLYLLHGAGGDELQDAVPCPVFVARGRRGRRSLDYSGKGFTDNGQPDSPGQGEADDSGHDERLPVSGSGSGGERPRLRRAFIPGAWGNGRSFRVGFP